VTGGPRIAWLPDGQRLYLHHGPIDLIVEAFGPRAEVGAAYRQATQAFDGVLQGLVDELALLRRPIQALETEPSGPVARRMVAAVRPHAAVFVTPMAAVAGAVADHMLAALVQGRRLTRAYVNNGGDIALHLAPGHRLSAGLVADSDAPALDGLAAIPFEAPVRGIATSGWRGRSLSRGIADSVTILAPTAAGADAAATLVANAVNVDHPAVRRRPAREVRDDTDLGDRLVTVAVGPLEPEALDVALARGCAAAEAMCRRGLIAAAALSLQRQMRLIATPSLPARTRAA
jgi:ApbE superfamily uncharacterized protein (UPF0280 family)